MSSDRPNEQRSVTAGEGQLFDFGPDVERPATGPVAALPPWMVEQQRAQARQLAHEAELPRAGQTIGLRLARAAEAAAAEALVGVPLEVPAEIALHAEAPVPVGVGADSTGEFAAFPGERPEEFAGELAGDLDGDLDAADVTPEPMVVPEFARIVPAPRKRRKPLPADRVVIAAPAVVDGQGLVGLNRVEGDADLGGDLAGLDAAPAVPAQRSDVPPTVPATAGATGPAAAGTAPTVGKRARRRWVGIAQVAGIVAVGASVGIYAAGGVGFLQNRTKADPPTAEATAWVLNNLAGAGSVLVPSSITDTLLQNGQDSDALTTYTAGSTADVALGKDCCDYLVLVGAPGQEPGTKLPDAVHTLFERSRPAAVFTTGGGWTQVRQVLPGSPEKVAKDLAADHAALVATGKSLIASGKVSLSSVAAQQVRDGEVDARVLIGIVAVALQHKITIASFPAQPGETDPAILRRSVALSAIDGKPVTDGSSVVKAVKGVLASQAGIYKPSGAEVHAVDGVTALEFRYDAPSPFGVLTLTNSDGKRTS